MQKTINNKTILQLVFLLEFNSLTVVTDQYIAVEIQQKLTLFLIFAQITSNNILWHESCNPYYYVGRKKSILTESVSIVHVYQLYNYFRNENNTEM